MTDTARLDLAPATRALARVVAGVGEDQLGLPTPCPESTVAQLLAHVDEVSVAFARAAAKQVDDAPGGIGDTAPADGWRARVPRQLDAMAEAWADPAAWTGQTRIGGTDQSGEICALIGLDEVIVHGWDLAVATGQTYAVDDDLAVAAARFVGPTAEQNPDGVPGLFGPALPVPEDAPALDRLLRLTGRDPGWRPA